LFGIRLAFTWIGAALAAAVVSFPLMVQTMRVAFEQVDPEWEEAGRVYGGGFWSVMRYVTLPLSARGIVAGVILAFARSLGEFGATIVLAGNIPGVTRTLPLAIFSKINRLGGEPAALRLVLITVFLSVVSMAAHALLTRHLHRH
jgi:molybdate transport system permease protein